jgi:hypothetical protein
MMENISEIKCNYILWKNKAIVKNKLVILNKKYKYFTRCYER